MLEAILYLVSLVASWVMYQKMGYQGWQGIIPGYNYYLLFEEFYGNGWKVFMLLIPFYGIYLLVRLHIDWAKRFNKTGGYGVGMLFLPFVFNTILAFGDAQYLDGSKAIECTDPITNIIHNVANALVSLTKKKG